MKKVMMLMSVAAGVAGSALAGGGHVALPSQAPQPTATAYRYACENGQSVGVRYIASDPDLKSDPVFAVLEYRGHSYGLAPAVSGSGSRYVGLSGLNTASGLEWWEHHGEAALSTYDPASGQTTPLLKSCRIVL